MKKMLFVLTALATTALLDSRPSQAYEAPWCAVHSLGWGGVIERCVFGNFETCRSEIVAGNRGFCIQNARWPGWQSNYAAGPAPRKARNRARY